MAARSDRVIVVADRTKLGAAGAARCVRVEDMDEIITDRGGDGNAIRALRAKGVRVTLV